MLQPALEGVVRLPGANIELAGLTVDGARLLCDGATNLLRITAQTFGSSITRISPEELCRAGIHG